MPCLSRLYLHFLNIWVHMPQGPAFPQFSCFSDSLKTSMKLTGISTGSASSLFDRGQDITVPEA